MAAGVRMFTGVAVRRTIAAQGDAAFLAGAEMHPSRADLDAFRALETIRRFDFGDRFDVRASSLIHPHLFYSWRRRCTNETAVEPSPTGAAEEPRTNRRATRLQVARIPKLRRS